jgi:hypothetical protein
MKWKKLVAAMLAAFMIGGTFTDYASIVKDSVITAGAEEEYTEVTEGVLTYRVYADHAELSECDRSVEGEITIPGKFKGVPVTRINSMAFYFCASLKSVTIPNSVTSIDKEAFAWCSSLKSVTIPDSVTNISVNTFQECSDLTSVTIPNSVTSIGDDAFFGCSSLESVTIPDTVTSIGNCAFQDCYALKSINIPDSVTRIGNQAFDYTKWLESKRKDNPLVIENGFLIDGRTCSGDVIIPDTVTRIADCAFSACTSLESVTIPATVTSIGANAFNDTAWLRSKQKENPLVIVNGILIDGRTCSGDVVIPDTVTSIGINAFANCTSLTSITLPDSVTSIDSAAIIGCTDLESIMLPVSVTSIGDYAFAYCTKLASVTILNPDCKIYDWATTICNDYDLNMGGTYYTGIIRGYSNSTAQAYAEKHGYKFEALPDKTLKKGDVDGNGRYNVNDATKVLREAALLANNKPGSFTPEQHTAADLDFNDRINVVDATLVMRYCAHLANSPTDNDIVAWLASIGKKPKN